MKTNKPDTSPWLKVGEKDHPRNDYRSSLGSKPWRNLLSTNKQQITNLMMVYTNRKIPQKKEGARRGWERRRRASPIGLARIFFFLIGTNKHTDSTPPHLLPPHLLPRLLHNLQPSLFLFNDHSTAVTQDVLPVLVDDPMFGRDKRTPSSSFCCALLSSTKKHTPYLYPCI